MKRMMSACIVFLGILGLMNATLVMAKMSLVSTPLPGSGGDWRCVCTNLTKKPISIRFYINSEIPEPTAAVRRTIAPACSDGIAQGGAGTHRNCQVTRESETENKTLNLTAKQVSCTFYSLGPVGYPVLSVPVDRKAKVNW